MRIISSAFRMMRLADKLMLLMLALSWFSVLISIYITTWPITFILVILALVQTAVAMAQVHELNKDERSN